MSHKPLKIYKVLDKYAKIDVTVETMFSDVARVAFKVWSGFEIIPPSLETMS